MEFTSMTYHNLKNGIIKAERRILKELGFCVHVKHPHKLIITYLQMIGHEKNKNLARRAWNYMNDSLRSDVFVRFKPETIACACIFLAARNEKVPLPSKPAWYKLFDGNYDDIEDISISILRLYSRPKTKIAQLESVVNKLRKEKEKAEKERSAALLKDDSKAGSFTPSQNEDSNSAASTKAAALAILNNNNSKPSSRTASPVEKTDTTRNSTTLKNGSGDLKKKKSRRSSVDSNSSTDSEIEVASRKVARNRDEKSRKRRSPSSDLDEKVDRRVSSKNRVSPDDRRRKNNKDIRSRETNGHTDKNNSRSKKRSRSRSPVKRSMCRTCSQC